MMGDKQTSLIVWSPNPHCFTMYEKMLIRGALQDENTLRGYQFIYDMYQHAIIRSFNVPANFFVAFNNSPTRANY